MLKWNVCYYGFIKVRKLLADGASAFVILTELAYACENIAERMNDGAQDFAEEFMEMKREIEELIAELNEEDNNIEVDMILNDFYDLCDNAHVWLGI